MYHKIVGSIRNARQRRENNVLFIDIIWEKNVGSFRKQITEVLPVKPEIVVITARGLINIILRLLHERLLIDFLGKNHVFVLVKFFFKNISLETEKQLTRF
jgi:hypothetical protein